MHEFITCILAASRDTSSNGLIIAAIVAIWVIGSIVSSAKKAKEKDQQRRARAPRPPVQAPARAQAQPKRMKVPAPVARQPKRRVPPPIPRRGAAPAAREPEPIMLQLADAAAQAPHPITRPASRATLANSIHRWLTPSTLQKQFILTEILQPPVGLRDNNTRSTGF